MARLCIGIRHHFLLEDVAMRCDQRAVVEVRPIVRNEVTLREVETDGACRLLPKQPANCPPRGSHPGIEEQQGWSLEDEHGSGRANSTRCVCAHGHGG